MVGFEHYDQEAEGIERQIASMGVALGIDWSDEARVRELAREALEVHAGELVLQPGDRQALAKANLFGLAGLMMKIMAESADHGIHTHGGTAWKAFGRALYLETEAARKGVPEESDY